MSRHARILFGIALVAVVFAGVVLVSSALADIGVIRRVAASFQGDDVVLVTNRTNRPIVTASRMMPGDQVRGSIKVGNFGDDPGVLWVKPRKQRDMLSMYGVALSKRLMLRIVSLSKPRGTVWLGYVRDLRRARLGVLKPSQVKRYRFIVQFRVRPPARGAMSESLFMRATYKTDWVFRLTPKR